MKAAGRLAAFLALLAGSGRAYEARGRVDDLPRELVSAPEVKDPVFAILIGLLDSQTYGTLTGRRLEVELGRRRSRLPYRRLLEIRRTAAERGVPAFVTSAFRGELREPIPYSILGYRPGRIEAAVTCTFREWTLGAVQVPHFRRVAGRLEPAPVLLHDVHLLVLAGGSLRIDFDRWLDFLLGASLDDTEVAAIAVFRSEGRWMGLALGRNRKGEARSGSFDFRADRIQFPFPAEMKAAARHLRARPEMSWVSPAGTDGRGGAEPTAGP